MISARLEPIRWITSEPRTAAAASSSTGRAVSMPTAFSFSSRSLWMSGSTGGTASTVIRRLMPASQSSARRQVEASNELPGLGDALGALT